MASQLQGGKSNGPDYIPIRIPSNKLEYGFYISLLYSLTADVWGISVPLLAPALFFAVFALCIWQVRSYSRAVYSPVSLLISCAISFILIQIVIHDFSILDESVRVFILWLLQIIIVHSLCLRQTFPVRYPLLLFSVGIVVLPFLTFDPGEVERARVSVDLGIQGALSHPNGLAEWFGFCAVYFAISGLITERFAYRIGAWVTAVGSLLIVALTVGRGSMLGASLAIIVGFRGILKRGFAPVFVLILVTGIGFKAGLFDQALSNYEERATEESGREVLWPAAIEEIFRTESNLLVGVGLDKSALYAISARRAVLPHNSFLYFALSSGIVPLAFYIAFWIQTGWRSLHVKGQEGDAFRLPYLIYVFVSAMLGDLGFMLPWALLALSVAAGSNVVYGKRRFVLIRRDNKTAFGISPGRKPPDSSTLVRSEP
jgi:hypothetical protein